MIRNKCRNIIPTSFYSSFSKPSSSTCFRKPLCNRNLSQLLLQPNNTYAVSALPQYSYTGSIDLRKRILQPNIFDRSKNFFFSGLPRCFGSNSKDIFQNNEVQLKNQLNAKIDDDWKWKDLGLTKIPFRDPDSPGRVRHRRRRPSMDVLFDATVPSSFPPATWNYFRKKRREEKFLKEVNSMKEVRVQSIHVSQTIDLVAALSKVFNMNKEFRAVKHHFGKNCLIVQLPSETYTSRKPREDVDDRFVAIFRFGSVVFFNVSDNDRKIILSQIRDFTSSVSTRSNTNKVMTGLERREFFQVVIQPSIAKLHQQQDEVVQQDYAVIDKLNIDSVGIISTIMAQTVALDTYSDIVDGLLNNFDNINSSVKDTGRFTAMDREALFKAIAQNNAIFIDMMSKLGIKERSDLVWNLAQYEQLHEGLREEFEIDDRFDQIELKLNMIQQNAKFFLDIIHNQKSNVLEWVIIVLILFECILMIMEMSGFGETVFSYLTGKGTTDAGNVAALVEESSTAKDYAADNSKQQGKTIPLLESNLSNLK